MKILHLIHIFIAVSLILTGCIKPFDPQIEEMEESYLVVDALIDIRTGQGKIILSRTQSLDVVNRITYEAGSSVWLETENGKEIPFIEINEGVYTSELLGFEKNDIIRLNINTKENGAYQSDFVPVKISPEIDSISWKADDDGLNFYVNTHDPTNNTRYYRWEYIETAEYNSRFFSKYIYNGNTEEIEYRDQINQNIYICWRTDTSTNILLGNSSKLTEDLIIEKEIRRFGPESWEHRFKYSILVRQFALTEEEYDYWNTIEQSTENIGSLNDTQPSNIVSNIRSITNPGQPVIGFFSVGSSTEKRAIVHTNELPINWKNRGYFIPNFCDESDAEIIYVEDFYAEFAESALIVDVIYSLFTGEIVQVIIASDECIDCSYAKRGSPIRPEYW